MVDLKKLLFEFRVKYVTYKHSTFTTLCDYNLFNVIIPQQDWHTSTLLRIIHDEKYFAGTMI